uniref:Uncharacterized protein n=1 Tax=Psilocybe cubensis TaxID=181762 RepID=A0A8H7XLJ2_PSICU
MGPASLTGISGPLVSPTLTSTLPPPFLPETATPQLPSANKKPKNRWAREACPTTHPTFIGSSFLITGGQFYPHSPLRITPNPFSSIHRRFQRCQSPSPISEHFSSSLVSATRIPCSQPPSRPTSTTVSSTAQIRVPESRSDKPLLHSQSCKQVHPFRLLSFGKSATQFRSFIRRIKARLKKISS